MAQLSNEDFKSRHCKNPISVGAELEPASVAFA